MSKELSLDLDEGIVLYTVPNVSEMYIDGDVVPLNQDTLGKMAEWLAAAWENVAGEEYKPVVITERGYVVDMGDAVEIATRLTRAVNVERDCE